MRVEGTERELKKLFKPKERKSNIYLKKTGEFISEHRKQFFILSMVLIISISMAYVVVSILDRNKISNYECNQKVIEAYRDNPNMDYKEKIFIEFLPFLRFLLIMIGIGWILHGVGFKIIGR